MLGKLMHVHTCYLILANTTLVRVEMYCRITHTMHIPVIYTHEYSCIHTSHKYTCMYTHEYDHKKPTLPVGGWEEHRSPSQLHL